MPNLTFYTNPQSRGRIIRWMLEEVGEPYDTVILEYGTTMKGADYLAVNPMGKVPAIKHGDTVVTECAAICAYLADAFPENGLAPEPGSLARGAYYRWLFFAAGPIEAAVSTRALGWEVPEERKRMAGWGSFDDTMDVLEQALTGCDYLAGGRFSAADLYLGSQLGFGMMFGMIDRRPAFDEYVARLQARPAAHRANELDDAATPRQEPNPQPQPA